MVNLVVLEGALSRPPSIKVLPSGDQLLEYQVTVREDDRPTESVPVVWVDPPARAGELAAGVAVVVVGRVRRRYFKTATGTASRTEVVADAVIPARQRKRVQAATDAARAKLEARVA